MLSIIRLIAAHKGKTCEADVSKSTPPAVRLHIFSHGVRHLERDEKATKAIE